MKATCEVLLAVVAFTTFHLHAACVPEGAVAWWRAEGNALDSAGSNHGSLPGGTSFTPAVINSGFVFDSDDDGVTIPHNAALDINPTGFTVECRMRAIKNQPDPFRYLVVDKSHGWIDFTGWALQGDSGSGLIAFVIAQGDFAPVGEIFSAADVLDGQFHHVAGTWDGATMRLYVDGVVQNSMPLTTPANNTRPVNMGFSWGGGSPTRFFRGALDEMRLYQRALSATEVQAIYSGSADCGNPPVLWTGNCHLL